MHTPPTWISSRLLLWVLPARLRGTVAGDLEEEACDRIERGEGRWAAELWLAQHLIRIGIRYRITRPHEQAREAEMNPENFRTTVDPSPSSPPEPPASAVWVEDLARDVRRAFRGLLRSPGFSLVAILTLAVGLGANVSIFTVLDAVVLRPLPFPESERLVEVVESNQQGAAGVAIPTYLAWSERIDEIEAIESYSTVQRTLTGEGADATRVTGGLVSPGFPDLMGFVPLSGRLFLPTDGEPGAAPVVVIGERFWADQFGSDPQAVGSSVVLDGVSHEIVGILPGEARSYRSPGTESVWIARRITDADRTSPFLTTTAIVKLREGGSEEVLQSEAVAVQNQLRNELPDWRTDPAWTVETQSLRDSILGDSGRALYLLMGAVGALFLIALANLGNLFLARGMSRRGESNLQRALGASRGRIIQERLVEAVVVSLLGCAFGVVLAAFGTEALMDRVPYVLPRGDEVSVGLRASGFAVLLALVSGAVFGLLPAWRSSRTVRTVGGGRSGTLGERGSRRVPRLLVAAEAGLILVLLVGSGMLWRSLDALQNVDAGVDTEGRLAVQVSLPQSGYPTSTDVIGYFERLVPEVAEIAEITGAATTTGFPLEFASWNFFYRDDREHPPGEAPTTLFEEVTPNYFELLDIELLAGRTFDASARARAEPVVVINQQMADAHFPGEDPIGRRIGFERTGPWLTIVGVAENVQMGGPTADIGPHVYLPLASMGFESRWGLRQLILTTRSDNPRAALPLLRTAMEAIDPTVPLARNRTLDEIRWSQTGQDRFQTLLMAFFGVTALLLGLVGVYGVASQSVALRTTEVGVRMALGAAASRVVRQVLREELTPVVLGMLLGIAAVWLAGGTLRPFVFGISPRDPAVLIGAFLLLLLSGAVAVLLPARRASRTSPSESLRAG